VLRRALPIALAGAAVALAAGGGRFGRRAALRGALSVGVVAAARGRAPAVAAAFATGAAQELPLTAVPLGALAVAAGIAGVREEGMSPRRALAATAAGVGVAVATRRLWPVAPHGSAELVRHRGVADAPPAPDGAGVTVVVNASAGPGLTAGPADEIREALPEAKIVELADGDDLVAALESAAATSAAIGIAGGDGSINAAAGVARAAGKPLVVIPAGTLNHFARDLGIESVVDVVEPLRDGTAVAVDVASIDGHAFLNTASFGGYVDLVDAREQLEAVIGKWPAVVVALGRVLRRSEPLRVEIDGRRRLLWMVFIGNCCYKPSGFAPSWRERLDDGQLDIRLVEGNAPFSRLRLIVAVLTGTLRHCPVYEQFTTDHVVIRSLDGPLRLASDGETFDGADEFEICKAGCLAVYATPAR
jgi:undecaprenyl-diphosphatase